MRSSRPKLPFRSQLCGLKAFCALVLAMLFPSAVAEARLYYPLPGHATSDEPTEVPPVVIEKRIPHPAPFPAEEPEKPTREMVIVDGASPPGRAEVSIPIAATRGISTNPTPLARPEEPEGPLNPDDAEPLVLAISVNGTKGEEYLTGVALGRNSYISLGDMVKTLDFPIDVSPADRKASGWFLRQDNGFDLNDHHATVRGESYTLTDREILYQDGDIYVSDVILSKWFGLSFAVNYRELTLNIHSDEPLPFEERARRQRLRQMLSASNGTISASDLQRVDEAYERFSYPVVDLNITQNFGTASSGQNTTEYTLLSQGDLFHLSAETFLAGSLQENILTAARLRFSRRDENNELLGPLHASQFSFGDVNSQGLALVAGSSQGRGFALSNRSPYRSDQFDVTDFRGTATPGWDVELYRNGVLLDIRNVDTDGQYEFLNIPVYYGRNAFRIVLYGPQGQIQEENKEIYAGDTMLEAGDFTYALSVTENNRTLFGISDSETDVTGIRAVGELEYGVTKWLTAAAGAAQLEQGDGDHQYLTAGLRSSLLSALTSADIAYDPANGDTAGRVAVGTTLLGIDARLQQTWFGGIISDENTLASRLKQTTDLDFNKQMMLFSRIPLGIGIGIVRKQYENGDDETVLRARTSTSLLGISATNTIEHTLGRIGSTDGTLALRGSIGRVLVGASLDYDIEPDAKVTSLDLTSQFYPADNVVNRSQLGINEDRSYDFTNTVTLDRKKYGLSVITGGTSERNFFVGLGLNMSFTQLPDRSGWHFQSRSMSDTGGALVRAFLDKNGNSRRDEGEDYIKDATFLRNNTPIKAEDGSDHAVITQLSTTMPTRISVDKDQLEDPQYMPGVVGYEFVSRPGHIATIEIPVIETANLEGTAYFTRDGASTPAPRVHVELKDDSGASLRATLSEFDGYYEFPNVRPGKYTIHAYSDAEDPALVQSINREIELKSLDYTTADLQLK